jgi:putative ABC transport system ATP-binding protein
MSAAAKAVVLEDVSKVYGQGARKVVALRNLSLEIAEGEFVTIAGPSGSGKSSLLNLVGCLDFPSSGSILVAGENTGEMRADELDRHRSRKVGFVFQAFNLIQVLTVRENIELPLLLRPELKAVDRRGRVERFLRAVGLEAQGNQRANELSGGQRQRAAIARAIAGRPAIVLADEPTANLDSENAAAIIGLMRDLNRSEGTSIVFASHDPEVIAAADRVIRLKDGRIFSEARR